MGNVWFWSDPHLGHKLVSGIRGYKDSWADPDPDAHDADLADAWDSHVGFDDDIWILGDISAGGTSAQRNALRWFSLRPGRKHLIAGNHDGVHPMHRDSHKWQKEYLATFDSVQSAATRRIPILGEAGGHRTVVLSHFPYEGEGDRPGDDRFTQWRLRDEGVPIIHGHTHAAYPLSITKAGTRQVHVGVDTWPKPVRLDQVSEMLED